MGGTFHFLSVLTITYLKQVEFSCPLKVTANSKTKPRTDFGPRPIIHKVDVLHTLLLHNKNWIPTGPRDSIVYDSFCRLITIILPWVMSEQKLISSKQQHSFSGFIHLLFFFSSFSVFRNSFLSPKARTRQYMKNRNIPMIGVPTYP